MVSEPKNTVRHAALRQLLVERVNATATPSRPPVGSAPRSATNRGRLQSVLVTGFVSAAAVAVSVAALVLTQTPPVSPAGPVSNGTAPTTSVSNTATPSESPSARLITHTGWSRITREQLHAFTAVSPTLQGDPAHAAIWEEQAWLDIQCMASKGYLYDPIGQQRDDAHPAGQADTGLTPSQLRGYQIAFFGAPSDGPYDWRTAGCHGRSVHETGQDDAH